MLCGGEVNADLAGRKDNAHSPTPGLMTESPARSALGHRFLSNMGILLLMHHWNKLSDNEVNASTVNTFKNRLDHMTGATTVHAELLARQLQVQVSNKYSINVRNEESYITFVERDPDGQSEGERHSWIHETCAELPEYTDD